MGVATYLGDRHVPVVSDSFCDSNYYNSASLPPKLKNQCNSFQECESEVLMVSPKLQEGVL